MLEELGQHLQQGEPLPCQFRGGPFISWSGSSHSAFTLAAPKTSPFSLVGDQPAALEMFKPDARHAALSDEANQHQVRASLLSSEQDQVDQFPRLKFDGL